MQSFAIRLAVAAVVAACGLLSPGPAAAHGDLHARILQASRDIAVEPRNPSLYLARADLLSAHGEIRRALADYSTALRLNPELSAARLGRGRLLLTVGRTSEALHDLDRFVLTHPDHAEAWLICARASMLAGRRAAAVAAYERAVALNPTADWYIERAQAIRQQATAGTYDALRVLDEGLARLGPIPTIQLEAIRVARSAALHDEALRRLDLLITHAGRVPLWLAMRGDVLIAAGRDHQARAAYVDALGAIAALPPSRRATRQMAELRARLERTVQ